VIEEPLRAVGCAALLAVGAACAVSGACLAGSPGEAGSAAPTAKPAPPAPPSAKERDARRAEVRFPNGRLILAEIADTPEHWARGYMFRREVGEGDGMVFVFPEPEVRPFWMKNTLVPLDIIWLDEERKILHIEAHTPPCKADPCPSYGPLRKASTVLEVRAGTAAAEGLKAGDRLQISIPQPGD